MPSTGEMLREGIRLSKAGQKRQAWQVLAALVEQEPGNERAWMWLSDCADSEEQKRKCLLRVLEINPQNEIVRAYVEETWPASERVAGQEAAPLAPQPKPEDYAAAYEWYSRALEANPDRAEDWLARGFAAGMSSTCAQNRVREFVECLNRCLTCGPRKGFATRQAVEALDPALRCEISGCISALSVRIDRLAGECPPVMSNIYRIEQVHLADWAFLIDPSGGEEARQRLAYASLAAFEKILITIRATTRSARARQELTQTFRGLLLANLTLSGLGKDKEWRKKVDELIE